ncbi:hypothetical protein DMC47_38425 [Nostoc sp. 3335mG]|nr:hypothetical protein DMC47_38425 [Nostoc sp. 3335mG]
MRLVLSRKPVPALVQGVLVTLLVGVFTFWTDCLNFHSGWNILWMIGLPLVVAVFANNDTSSRCLAGLVLIPFSFFVVMMTGAIFGLGT